MDKLGQFRITISMENFDPDGPEAEAMFEKVEAFRDKIEAACESFRAPSWIVEID